MIWTRRCWSGRADQKKDRQRRLLHDPAAPSQPGSGLKGAPGSAPAEAPPALWPPTDTETARLTLWRAPRANFTTPAQVAQKSVSEWPVPDLHPIGRVRGAPSPPLHSSPEECCGSPFNTTAWLDPAGSLGRRPKSRRAPKQLETGTFTRSLC